ncbi:DUF4349 domain-containing protein [Pseudactinotalea sp. Z1748]|uniref:DUF4349 domain-containing protein n=1 Tax=Pseudactinotalea sp. Z1748 TaxID=3413027 RepID=UPI003C7DBE45
MRHAGVIAAATMVAGLGLAGCGSTGSDSGGAPETVEATREYREPATDADAGYDEAGGYADAADDGHVPSQPSGDISVREVITTAEVSIVVPDPAESANEVVRLAETAGGRVDQRSLHAADNDGDEDYPASAWLTVRIPAADLDDFLDDLDEVGEIRQVSQSSDDVTQVAQDLDARIEALETSTDRLLDIMAEAEDSADLIAAEEALSRRQGELESLRSQRAYLSDQVAMSTVHVDLTAERAPAIESDGFTGGLQTGWHAMISFVSALLVLAGVLAPWLAIVGVPLLALLLVLRRRRRSRVAGTTTGPTTGTGATVTASGAPGRTAQNPQD